PATQSIQIEDSQTSADGNLVLPQSETTTSSVAVAITTQTTESGAASQAQIDASSSLDSSPQFQPAPTPSESTGVAETSSVAPSGARDEAQAVVTTTVAMNKPLPAASPAEPVVVAAAPGPQSEGMLPNEQAPGSNDVDISERALA